VADGQAGRRQHLRPADAREFEEVGRLHGVPVTLNEATRGWRLGLAVAQYALTRRGILTLGTGAASTSGLPMPESSRRWGDCTAPAARITSARASTENYRDHYATRMNWRVKLPVTLNEATRGWRLGLAVDADRHAGLAVEGAVGGVGVARMHEEVLHVGARQLRRSARTS
jgi:hypothetical protein